MIGISFDEGKVKYVEQLVVGPVHVLFVVNPVSVFHDPGSDRGKQPGVLLNFGEVSLQYRTQFTGRPGAVVERYPVDTVGLFVVAVVAQFPAHVQEDQDRADQSHGQPEDVYRGISPLAAHVPQTYGELASGHHSSLSGVVSSLRPPKRHSRSTISRAPRRKVR